MFRWRGKGRQSEAQITLMQRVKFKVNQNNGTGRIKR